VVFVGDLVGDVLGSELESWWPGAKNLAKADDEGVPFAITVEKGLEENTF
jgi:hypothetical protein